MSRTLHFSMTPLKVDDSLFLAGKLGWRKFLTKDPWLMVIVMKCASVCIGIIASIGFSHIHSARCVGPPVLTRSSPLVATRDSLPWCRRCLPVEEFSDESSEEEDEGPGFFDDAPKDASETLLAAQAGRLKMALGVDNGSTYGKRSRNGTSGGRDAPSGASGDEGEGVPNGHKRSTGLGSSATSSRSADAVGKGGRPSNFSRVNPSLPRADLKEKFPLFLDAKGCKVEVKAGQMLYLPAGWFHEVSTFPGTSC